MNSLRRITSGLADTIKIMFAMAIVIFIFGVFAFGGFENKQLVSVEAAPAEQTAETVVTGQVSTLGEYFSLFRQQLSDSTTDACLSVFPLSRIGDQPIGGAETVCSVFIRQASHFDVFASPDPTELWQSWNIRVAIDNLPDKHCLISTPLYPGPKPLINCTF